MTRNIHSLLLTTIRNKSTLIPTQMETRWPWATSSASKFLWCSESKTGKTSLSRCHSITGLLDIKTKCQPPKVSSWMKTWTKKYPRSRRSIPNALYQTSKLYKRFREIEWKLSRSIEVRPLRPGIFKLSLSSKSKRFNCWRIWSIQTSSRTL